MGVCIWDIPASMHNDPVGSGGCGASWRLLSNIINVIIVTMLQGNLKNQSNAVMLAELCIHA